MRLKIDPTNPNGVSPVSESISYVSTSTSGGTGTSDHSELTNLDYASSGHTGFEPAKGSDDNYVTDTEKSNLHAPMSDNQVADGVTITGTGTVGDPFVAVTGGAGDVVGPSGATDGNFAAFNTNTGKLIKDSGYNSSSFAAALGTDDNYVTDAEKAALHPAVTVLDSSEIDFTLTGQQITAAIKSGSIDETKLDTSVNASLDLADSAIQTETDPVYSAWDKDHGDLINIGTNTHAQIDTKLASLLYDRETMKDPTGFTNNDAITVTYNSTTRKITLTGTFEAYYRGEKIAALVDGWESAAHATTLDKTYFLYYDGTNFVFNDTPWTFDALQIAYVQYGTNDKIALKETHGFMDWHAHQEFHNTIGAFRTAGGTLTALSYALNSTTAADRRPLIDATTMYDEDLKHVVNALSSESYTQKYLSGAGATRTFVTGASDIIPVVGATPYYNQYTGGAWQQTAMQNNEYAAVWLTAIPTTSDAGSQAYRYIWTQPQSVGTLAQINALTTNDLNIGDTALLVSEFVFIAKIVIQMTGNNWQLISVTNLTGNRYNQTGSPSGTYLSTVAHDATLTGSGTAGDPLVVVSPFTDEKAQDAVGNSVGNGLDYDDATGAISVDETELAHNSLGSKQGGTTNEYYHLTSAQHSALHAPVTVTDSTELDFTLTGQDITASIKSGSIDEAKLDTSVNASLDKADTAIQTELDPVFSASEAYHFAAGDASKLAGIEAGAEVNVQADWNQATNTADDYIKNKPTIPTQYTDEKAQDAVGAMVNTTLTYTDGTPELKVTNPVIPAAVGFTITAGTTAKTLTVPLDASVSGTNTGDQTNISGNAATVTVADEAADTTCFPLFATAASGSLGPKTNTNLTYNSSTAKLTSPNISVDYLTEKSAGNGVSVDSMVIKDGLVVGGAGTGVSNASLDTTAGGIGGVWLDWTPSWTNLNIAQATLNFAKYTLIGKTVHFRLKLTLSAAAISGSVRFSSPVTMATGYTTNTPVQGNVILIDTGTTEYAGYMIAFDTSAIIIRATTTSGSYASSATLSSSVPHTWANTDVISVSGTYEAA